MNSDDRIVYLDNAATSWPKPPETGQAMADFIRDAGGNPGRSGHRLSIAAGRARSVWLIRCVWLSWPMRRWL